MQTKKKSNPKNYISKCNTTKITTHKNYLASHHSKADSSNMVSVFGTITSECTYNHHAFDEDFYISTIDVARLSSIKDSIIIRIPGNVYNEYIKGMSLLGLKLELHGEFNSHNIPKPNGGIFVELFLKVTSLKILDDLDSFTPYLNLIYLHGFICRKPNIKYDSKLNVISETILAIHRNCGKSDYIPIVSWNKIAESLSSLPVGIEISIYGRVQSRKYLDKKTSNYKTTYEISIFSLKY